MSLSQRSTTASPIKIGVTYEISTTCGVAFKSTWRPRTFYHVMKCEFFSYDDMNRTLYWEMDIKEKVY